MDEFAEILGQSDIDLDPSTKFMNQFRNTYIIPDYKIMLQAEARDAQRINHMEIYLLGLEIDDVKRSQLEEISLTLKFSTRIEQT
jgi:hypothetical protein